MDDSSARQRCNRFPTILAIALLWCGALGAEAGSIAPEQCLVVTGVGRVGRTPLHRDAVEAQIVAGTMSAPLAGDTVALPDGSTREWKSLEATGEGAFSDSALSNGYAYVSVESNEERPMVLEAGGHTLVYVNGEIRQGDVYSFGTMPIPILLMRGTNHFLFRCERNGRLNMKLVDPESSLVLRLGSLTTPDLIVGESGTLWGSVLALNCSRQPLESGFLRCGPSPDAVAAVAEGIATTETPLAPLAPMSARKMLFSIDAKKVVEVKNERGALEDCAIGLALFEKTNDGDQARGTALTALRVRRPDEQHKRTFVSEVDGSVQYYAVQPMSAPRQPGVKPAMFLSLHGAGVEANGQAGSYGPKAWGYVVAPTNRHQFGFDWEEWSRDDAMEALADAERIFQTDRRRTYLTGHSMGGHGTWHIGLTFPDRFAAIAPSAGWASFISYVGPRSEVPEPKTPIEQTLRRAGAPGDTLTSLTLNYGHHGVYVLHGDADDVVPVSEAREMRRRLETFHENFEYFEQPGAGHWWSAPGSGGGAACVDWPPIFDFFSKHTIPATENVRDVRFYTACPGVSASSHWVAILAQIEHLKLSSVDLHLDPAQRRFSGATENVAWLELDVEHLAAEPIEIDIDGMVLANVPYPTDTKRLWIQRIGAAWHLASKPPLSQKGPHRYGLFKDAFHHRFLFVRATQGTPEENAWAFAKARYDSELWAYRGNGIVDIINDVDFDPKAEPDRSVILYGNAESNAAWKPLLGAGPVEVRRNGVQLGERFIEGDDLACLCVRPRPGSDVACVGIIGGTGMAGLRMTNCMPHFIAGVAYPDCIVVDSESLSTLADGVRAAGFFGLDWGVESGQFVWQP